jgi:hypothetical protein
MKSMRVWLAAGFAWWLMLTELERLHPEPGMVPFVSAFAGLGVLALLFLPSLARVPRHWLLVGALGIYAVSKIALGYPLGGVLLAQTLLEGAVIGATLLLWQRVGAVLLEFQDAVMRMTLAPAGPVPEGFEVAQGQIYREVRRARRHRRPLTLVAIRAEGAEEAPPNELLELMQREGVERYAVARLARLLADQTQDCDVVAERDGHLVTLLPETGREEAEQIVGRIASEARSRLGLSLRVGLSTFPNEEVTFDGLIKRAEDDMRVATPRQASESLLDGVHDSGSAPEAEADSQPPDVAPVEGRRSGPLRLERLGRGK